MIGINSITKKIRFAYIIFTIFIILGGVAQPAMQINFKKSDFICYTNNEKTNYDNIQQIIEQIHFSTPKIKKEEGLIQLTVPECLSYLRNNGKPMLPTYTKIMTFPITTKIIDINFNVSSFYTTKIYQKIVPAPNPIQMNKINTNYNNTIKFDDEAYSSSTPYPNTWCDYNVGIGIKNGKRVVLLSITVYPVRYLAGKNTIQYIKNITVSIFYNNRDPAFFPTVNNSYDLLIITPNKFSDELSLLIEHKNHLNPPIKTMLETTEYIESSVVGRDKAEKIKYYIKQAIENWNIRYVLLVGDNSLIPARKAYVDAEDIDTAKDIFASDLYYADIYKYNSISQQPEFDNWDADGDSHFAEFRPGYLDDVDLYPDVYLGRLACQSESEVKTIVDKIIAYETMEKQNSSWFNRMILCGGDTNPGEPPVEGEYINQRIAEIMKETSIEKKSFIGLKLWASLDTLTVSRIEEEINQGAGFIDFSGHGIETAWSTYQSGGGSILPIPNGFTTEHMEDLHNSNGKYPIAIISACYCGDFTYKDPCLAWKLIQHPNGGAIACCANTYIG